MGLFDFFAKKKDAAPSAKPKEVARLERLVSNKLSQDYDRQEAIAELCKLGTAESAAALLKRFDWSLDPSITDQDEKENCVRGIVAAGEDALEPIREYCRKAGSLTWPLRAMKGIVPAEGQVEELLGLLDLFDTEYVRNVEPKLQLLKELAERPGEEVRVAVEPFINDMSEPVRFEAVTAVFAMNDAESVAALVEQLSADESLRVKNRVAQGLADKGWQVPDELQNSLVGALPPGFRLDGSVVKAR
ncbi:MAG TPA: HEAT repeat domain-containing protein [Polyangiaceae bacterium]|nr:HEAT repeat domain-containing protein [Polyangiaceae bacterium]